MAKRSEITYSEWNTTPAGRAALHDLLRDIFKIDVTPLVELDLLDPTYRPFSYLDEAGRCIANVSSVSLPLVIRGAPVNAMGIQSVATRPPWRRRGLCHALMSRALAWCDDVSKTTLLYTAIPDFYLPFGFRIVEEHSFIGSAPIPKGAVAARQLSWSSQDDRLLLRRLLLERSPVSKRFAVRGMAGLFVLNAIRDDELKLHYLTGMEAVVATSQRPDGTLQLADVIAQAMPPLANILGALGASPHRIEVCFPPDNLAWSSTAYPTARATVLMVRGDFAANDQPLMLPPTAAF